MSRRAVVAVALSLLTLAGALSVLPAVSASPGPGGAAPLHTPSAPAPTLSPRPTTASAAPGGAARAALQDSVLSHLRTIGVPTKAIYLPNFQGGGRLEGNVVSPITRIAPAPMGVGDFGVRNTTGTPQPYVIDSTSWEGTVTLNSGDFFYIDNDGPDTFGIQLNAVLSNVTVAGSSNNDYWIQDVMYFTPSQSSIQFIDNIWNLSNPSTAEPASTFYSYNGTPTGSFYYDFGPTFTTGFPFTAHLYVNASLTNTSGSEYSTVRFGYDLVGGAGNQIGHGIYDTVEFNSKSVSSPTVPLPQFQVNGGALTPTNFLLYDTELMIGGPGGGSTTQVYALNGTMGIAYYNRSTGHYQNDPTAWTAGTDTGETSQGIAVSYTTSGTAILGAGPSFVEPLWNATVGGNAGRLRLTGTLSPGNAFIFLSPGNPFNSTVGAWAPTLPGATYTFYLPPGVYSGEAMLSDHDTRTLLYSGIAGGTSTVNIALPYDQAVGVDTPLFAWNNAELSNISYAGNGTLGNPYLLYNNQFEAMSALFGELNDFLFPVFPGVLVSGTTAYFDLFAPAPFTVLLPSYLDAKLYVNSLPDTNQLQIELYDTVHATVLDGSDIGGWICGCQFNFSPEPYYPDGEIVLWGATDSLIAGNVFQDQGVGLVLMQGSNNVVFGNEFLNGLLGPATFPAQFGIWEFESGDLIYNNVFDTSVTAYSPDRNLYNGNLQDNVNSWNLTGWTPSSDVRVVNGVNLSGSVLGAPAVCGNWWYDYAVGSQLPYNETYDGNTQGFIFAGGDYCPSGPEGAFGYDVTFAETGLPGGSWTVDLAGVIGTAAAGDPIVFAMPNGTWAYTIDAVAGLLVSPPNGTVTVRGGPAGADIAFKNTVAPVSVEYLATITEFGLPAGTAWSVVVNATPYDSNGTTVALTLINGTYPYSVNAVADYSLAPPTSGSISISGGGASVFVHFTPDAGWLNATFAPTSATVTVDGGSTPLSSGAFSIEEMPGTYAIVATATGYAPYFNNVTVRPGLGSAISAHLTLVGTTQNPGSGKNGTTNTTTASGLTSTQFYGLIGALIVVAIAIVLAALLLRRRGGSPPPTTGAAPTAPAAEPEPEMAPEGPQVATPGGADVYWEGPPEGGSPPPSS
jgi:thermopsin